MQHARRSVAAAFAPRNAKRLMACLAAVATSAGCASMTHFKKEVNFSEGNNSAKTIVMDAKQRVVTNAMVDGKLRVCAEPSPDALSALAASAGLSLSRAEALDLAGNASLAEGVGSIGLRTQSIQLMRDAMYRLCEGYVSGAIDSVAFETLHRRFQSSMVAILAIEQLTGAVRAPTIILGGSSSQGNAERAAELTEKTEAARRSLRAAETTLAAKEAATAKAEASRDALQREQAGLKEKEAPTDKEKARLAELEGLITKASDTLSKAQAEEEDASDAKDNASASFEALDAARRAALAGGGTAGVSGEVFGPNSARPDISGTVSAVRGIVEDALNLEFGRELCATLLTKPASTSEPFTKCVAYLDETVQGLKARRDALAAVTPILQGLMAAVTQLMSDPSADAAKIKAAAEVIAATEKVLGSLSSGSTLLAQ